MICYRDMVFCAAECANLACKHNRWHVPADTELPVAIADFSEDCPEYEPSSDECTNCGAPLKGEGSEACTCQVCGSHGACEA